GDIVDQLLDENGLADAGTAEEADLAALGIGSDQVDHLDARNEDRGFGRLVDELGGLGVDRRLHVAGDGAALVDRVANDVEDATKRLRTDGDRNLRAGVDHRLPAGQAVGGVHRNGANGVLAEVLRDFKDKAAAVVV